MKMIKIAAMVMGVLVCSLAQGQVVRIKAQATAEFRQDVRLGDVATVSGVDSKQAEQLSDMVVVADIEKPVTIKAEAILMALISQRGPGGAVGNNLQIGGSSICEITVVNNKATAMGAVSAVEAPAAPVVKTKAPAATTQPGAPASQPALPEVGTLRDAIMARLMTDSGLPRDQLQLDINSTSPLVDAPVEATQKWLVRPLSRTPQGVVPFETQLVQGTKVLQRLNVETEVKWYQKVLVTTDKIGRGDVITAEKVRYEEVWLDRKMPTLFHTDKEVIGLEAQRDVDAGTQVDQRDFKPLLMAHKGDFVTVLYVDGPVQVQLRGRAQADARFHQQITVQSDKSSDTYQVVMLRKNMGVAGAISAVQEKQLIDAQ